MRVSLFHSPTTIDDAVATAERARAAGVHRYWVPQVRNADPISILSVVGREVADIRLGTSVVAMQTTLPQILAQQARTVNQISGGRFTLGLGVNHEPVVTAVWGLEWRKPFTHLSEYLDALLPLLSDQAVSTSGEFVTTHAQIDVPSETPEVMLAALGPKMLKMAAERTQGTITWMTGPATIADHVRPNIGDKDVVAAAAIWITDDVDARRATADKILEIYGQLPSYRAMMDREGAKTPGDLVLIGDEATVRAGAERYREAGTSEIVFNVLGQGDELEAGMAAVESIAAD